MCCCFLFVFAAKINTETSVFVNENVFVSYEHEICSKNAAHAQCFCICKPFIDYIRVFKRFYCCYIFQFFRRIFSFIYKVYVYCVFFSFASLYIKFWAVFVVADKIFVKRILCYFDVFFNFFNSFQIH